jgi:5-methylcytosine-specific restriction enzyme subunit McrC
MSEVCLQEWSEVAIEGLVLDEAGQRAASQLTESSALEILELATGLRIRARAHVGRVQLGGLTVTVQPKIPGPQLIRLLQYAYGLTDMKQSDDVKHESATGGFRDLLVWQLAVESERLIRRGLRREYMAREEELVWPRGRIDMSRLARKMPGRASLPCRHQPRSLDCSVNQLLMAGMGLARRDTVDRSCRSRLGRLMADMGQSIKMVPLSRHTLQRGRRQMNRLTSAYEPAMQLIELLLDGEGVVLDSARNQLSATGFLFDMNRFFQALLSRFLSDNLPGSDLRDERQLRGMMRYEDGANPLRRRPPTPRPDFTVVAEGRIVAMLDAKYRDLWEKELPSSMLYQLAMYALSRSEARQATILYPTLTEAAEDQVIRVEDPLHGGAMARVIVRPVQLETLAAVVFSSESMKDRREREGYARHLAMGA